MNYDDDLNEWRPPLTLTLPQLKTLQAAWVVCTVNIINHFDHLYISEVTDSGLKETPKH